MEQSPAYFKLPYKLFGLEKPAVLLRYDLKKVFQEIYVSIKFITFQFHYFPTESQVRRSEPNMN